MRHSALAVLLVFWSVATFGHSEPKPKKPVMRMCPATTIRGVEADPVASLRAKDYKLLENSSFWEGRTIPGVTCSSGDKNKLAVKGGIFRSDAMDLCRYREKYLKNVEMKILRYNRSIASSLDFQAATGCHPE